MLETLKELCLLTGISGRENRVRDYILKKLSNKAEVTVDALGNIIAFVKGNKRPVKKIMLDAHMDEVGMLVTSVLDDGMLKFSTVGGINVSALLSQKVLVNGKIPGVISSKPIHLMSADERGHMPSLDSLYIDIGAKSKQEALEVIKPGDSVTFVSDFENLGDLILSKAIDDRAGCAALIDIIEKGAQYDFYAVFSVQEEVGLRGAKTAAFTVDPEFCIVLESTTAADIEGVPEHKKVCHVSKGAVLSFMDTATLYDKKLFDFVLETATEQNILCQIKSMVAGGNNAGAIHLSKGGVKTATISVPCRYLHSPSSVASFEDVKAVRNLAEKVLERLASGEFND